MINYLFTFCSKIKSWGEAKVQESKQPLSKENAYVLASIGKKHGNYSDITKGLREEAMDYIINAANYGHNYALIEFPKYASSTHKKELIEFLTDLKYNICYNDNEVILVSWMLS